jgi:putative oxidoreductase
MVDNSRRSGEDQGPTGGGSKAGRAVAVLGRVLVAMLFVFAGLGKILGPQPFLEHMTQFGVPTLLLPAVIALELGAGLLLLSGWRVRYTAGALGIFCVLTAVIFHHELGVKTERTHFFKDLAIAGGLLAMSTNASAGRQRRSLGGAEVGRANDSRDFVSQG